MLKVSVVVPVFNAQPFLPETLACLQRQSLDSFEVLLVDDGSVDRSADVLRATADTDTRFQFFGKPNGGVGSARNLGLSMADGEYVCFIDADDRISDDYLEELYAATSPEKPDIVVTGNVIELWPDGSTNPRRVGVSGKHLLKTPDDKSPLVTTTGLTQNKLYKLSFLREIGLEHYKGKSVSEDNYFTICSIALARTVKTIQRGKYEYRQHHSSITKSRKKANDASIFDVYDQARSFVSKQLNDSDMPAWHSVIWERQRIDFVNFHNELAPPDRGTFRKLAQQLTQGNVAIEQPSGELRRIVKYYAKLVLTKLGLYHPS